MLHEERKISKIVEELTVYFLAIGADDVSSEIKIGDGPPSFFGPITVRNIRNGWRTWRNI